MTTAASANGLARRLGALEAAARPVDPQDARRALAVAVLARLQAPVYRAHWAAISQAVLRNEHVYHFTAAHDGQSDAVQRAWMPATGRPTYTRRIVLYHEESSSQDSQGAADVPVRYIVLWYRADWGRGERAQSSIVRVTVITVAHEIVDAISGSGARGHTAREEAEEAEEAEEEARQRQNAESAENEAQNESERVNMAQNDPTYQAGDHVTVWDSGMLAAYALAGHIADAGRPAKIIRPLPDEADAYQVVYTDELGGQELINDAMRMRPQRPQEESQAGLQDEAEAAEKGTSIS